MKTTLMAMLLVGLSLAVPSLHAAPRFTGPIRYEFANQSTQVTLSCDLIQNNSKENATGSLQVQLWASNAPYESGTTIHGHMVANTGKLEGLAAGQYYKDFRKTVAYTPPPAKGSYFMTLLLLEYKGNAYVIVHHINLTNRANLGPLPLFTMTGPWRYQPNGEAGTVEIQVAKISHRRQGNTGGLKLSVWLTHAPYSGGYLQGFEIGQVRKDALKKGFAYTDVKNVAKYVRPPNGDYYPALILSEFDGKEFKIVSWLTLNNSLHYGP